MLGAISQVFILNVQFAADGFDHFERERASEHREAPQQHLLRRRQKLVMQGVTTWAEAESCTAINGIRNDYEDEDDDEDD